MTEPGFTQLPDLAVRTLGGSVPAANDEFFAERENLVRAAAPVYQPHTFGHKGQIYDGWETRRRREPGHDQAIIQLGAPGVVHGVNIDTSHFRGNYPTSASVEACGVEGYPSPEELADAEWVTIVPESELAGDAHNMFAASSDRRFTHVRLTIHPDGGVARLRVHGEVVPDPRLLAGMPLDLAALENGGVVTGCSNMFFGSPNNLILPGQARHMGEGWETARRRDPDNDWVVVRLVAPGYARLVEVDTTHFKGNAPGAAALRGIDAREVGPEGLDDPDAWFELLPRTPLQPDVRHRLRTDAASPATHVRLDAYPDGGMSRLRLYGDLTEWGPAELALRWFNRLPAGQAERVLTGSGWAVGDARTLVGRRPLTEAAELPRGLRT